jgi:hypothetical protein
MLKNESRLKNRKQEDARGKQVDWWNFWGANRHKLEQLIERRPSGRLCPEALRNMNRVGLREFELLIQSNLSHQ